MRRRTPRARGFAMVDALVALAVASLTMVLLTSATWGLRIASERRAALTETAPVDWLLARRTLSAWVADASNDGPRASGASFIGTATTMRLIVRDARAAQSFVGEFRVTANGDDTFTLSAARHDGLQDARTSADAPRTSDILTSGEQIRFLYLFQQPNGAGTVWRYETGDGETLPVAVAIEAGDTRQVTVPVFATVSETCLSALGPGAIDGDQCAVR